MFDIANFDTRSLSEVGVDMAVLNPRTQMPFLDPHTGKPITLTLMGRNSTAFKNVQKLASLRDADRAGKSITKTEEDFENDRFEALVAVTKGWSFDTLDGQPFPFSADNVRKLWADGRWNWLKVQAFNFVGSEGNFLAKWVDASPGGQSASSV